MRDEIAFCSEKSSGFETRDSNMFKIDLLQNKKNKNEISNEIAYLEIRKMSVFTSRVKKKLLLKIIRYVSFVTKRLIHLYVEKDHCYIAHRQHDVITSNIFIILF